MKIIPLVLLSSLIFSTFSWSQERLTLNGKEILYKNKPLYLHGANTIAQVGKISESDAQNFQDMGMNFVRLIIDIDAELDLNDTEGDGDFIKQSALDNWKTVASWFSKRQIWINLEVRTNDYDLDNSALWTPSSAFHNQFTQIWKSLATTFKNQDYIAAYGLLAEHGQGKISTMKAAFVPIMQAIDIIDGKTPFTFGPKLNSIDYYDFNKYSDLYWNEYQNRIIYQINHLHPKPFINKDPAKGYDPATWWYHRTNGQNGAGADNDGSMNKAGTLVHLTPGLNWRDHYNAPIYIDQWGCDFTQPGYLDYERDMLEIFAENGQIPNTRWTYYMSGARGIMNDFSGTWNIHQPLFDFFKASSAGLIWPHEVAVSNENAADNHITTYATSNTLPWNIDLKFSAPFISNKIEVWSGNTTANEDPQSIDIYGSSDSLNWTFITNINNISWSQRQGQYTSPSFVNSKAYLYYRAQVKANHGGTQTVMSNLEFFPSAQNAITPAIEIKNKASNISWIYSPKTQILSFVNALQKPFQLKLYSIKGDLLQSFSSENLMQNQIQLKSLPSGVYLIHYSSPTEQSSFKILKSPNE